MIRGVIAVALTAALLSCADKKTEENIRSLERRVAALERKIVSGAVSENPASGQLTSDTGTPAIQFEQLEYDWGTLEEGAQVEHIFRFRNTGGSPLIINKASATCGCTVPTWPRDPVSAGGSGEIRVVFDSRARLGQQAKYVTITANTIPENTRLKISGMVVPSVN